MAYKRKYKRRGNKKKYSLNERLHYHNSRVNSAFSRAQDSQSAFKLFKNPKIAYSEGFVDGVNGNTQFSTINKYGGDEKAYAKGVSAGTKAEMKIRDLKF